MGWGAFAPAVSVLSHIVTAAMAAVSLGSSVLLDAYAWLHALVRCCSASAGGAKLMAVAGWPSRGWWRSLQADNGVTGVVCLVMCAWAVAWWWAGRPESRHVLCSWHRGWVVHGVLSSRMAAGGVGPATLAARACAPRRCWLAAEWWQFSPGGWCVLGMHNGGDPRCLHVWCKQACGEGRGGAR